ncbi:hypothetical protein FKM82_023235 [Ascaphus truei]
MFVSKALLPFCLSISAHMSCTPFPSDRSAASHRVRKHWKTGQAHNAFASYQQLCFVYSLFPVTVCLPLGGSFLDHYHLWAHCHFSQLEGSKLCQQ